MDGWGRDNFYFAHMSLVGYMRVCLAAFRAENSVRANSKSSVISCYVTGSVSGNKDIRGLNGAF